jgi:uncharacterized membrane protein
MNEKKRKKLWNTLKRDLLTGFLAILPLGATVWVFQVIFGIVGRMFEWIPGWLQPSFYLGFDIPGAKILMTFCIMIGIGALSRRTAGKVALAWGERVIKQIPFARSVYSSIKQLLQTVFKSGSGQFNKVCLIEYPRKGIWSFAFPTGVTVDAISPGAEGEKYINVFLPSTPNPTTGFYLVVAQSEVRELSISPEQAFKIIMSAGVLSPENKGMIPGGHKGQ